MTDYIKARLAARRHDGEADRGDLVQTVLLVAGFAIAAIFVVTWVGGAIMNKGADAANCIEQSNTYADEADDAEAACENGAGSNGKSYKEDGSYTDRYGN